MLAKTESVALIGAEGRLVEVEVHVADGVPRFTIVGLPTKSVREAEQRTRSALESAGQRWPVARIVANLAPGGLPKQGTHFDLALALGVLAGADRIPRDPLDGWLVMGELALDGGVRPVRGVLAAAMACHEAGRRGLICPRPNGGEAALVGGIEVIAVETLEQAVSFLGGRWTPPSVEPLPEERTDGVEDMVDVRGHPSAKRAVEIAAAGGHNVLLTGPPGAGKTMLARRLPGILPRMSMDESLEVTRIHSVAGMLAENAALVSKRPFRTPHHNVSMAGLIGGGPGLARPGEISLAHHGVLFLDEIALYRSDVLDALRGPVEEGAVRIARSGGAVTFPCRFALVAAMNPCPCGYRGDARRACGCSDYRLDLYRGKLSGPLLDRFDVEASMTRLTRSELLAGPTGEPSDAFRTRVQRARDVQSERYSSQATTNASASKAQADKTISLTAAGHSMMSDAVDALALSGRAFDRVVRVARTIADLAGSSSVDEAHLAEALSLRSTRPDRAAA